MLECFIFQGRTWWSCDYFRWWCLPKYGSRLNLLSGVLSIIVVVKKLNSSFQKNFKKIAHSSKVIMYTPPPLCPFPSLTYQAQGTSRKMT